MFNVDINNMSHFYILYKIVNKLNNKFYIGVHKTNDINDEYYGSGNLIKAAVQKYGIENFDKKILQIFTNSKEAFAEEKKLVNHALIKNKNCYNIKEGGRGGFDFIRSKGLHLSSKNKKIIHHPLTGQQTKVSIEDLPLFLNEGWKQGFKQSTLEKMSQSGKVKIQSPEQRRKNSESKKNCELMRSPETGRCKFIKKYNVNKFLSEGWTIVDRGKGQRKSSSAHQIESVSRP